METLNAMEKVETDEKDRPKETIKILATQVFVDPFTEIDEQVRKNFSNFPNLCRFERIGAILANPS